MEDPGSPQHLPRIGHRERAGGPTREPICPRPDSVADGVTEQPHRQPREARCDDQLEDLRGRHPRRCRRERSRLCPTTNVRIAVSRRASRWRPGWVRRDTVARASPSRSEMRAWRMRWPSSSSSKIASRYSLDAGFRPCRSGDRVAIRRFWCAVRQRLRGQRDLWNSQSLQTGPQTTRVDRHRTSGCPRRAAQEAGGGS